MPAFEGSRIYSIGLPFSIRWPCSTGTGSDVSPQHDVNGQGLGADACTFTLTAHLISGFPTQDIGNTQCQSLVTGCRRVLSWTVIATWDAACNVKVR